MATYLQFSLRNEEIYDLLLHIHPIVADGCFHQPSVDAHHRMFGIFHLHFPGAIGVHAAMIQEATRYQKPDALNQLNHLGMVDHTHVEHAVIWYGIRRLAIAGTTADTDRHHLALNHVGIDLQFHLILHPVEKHHEERRDKRQGTRAEKAASLSAQVHDVCRHADIQAVQEIAVALVTIGIEIADTAKVHLADTTLNKPVDRLLDIVVIELPEAGEVIHDAVGDHSQGDAVSDGLLLHHQAVHRIVQSRVAAHDDDRLVAVADHHLHEPLDAVRRLTLHEIVIQTTGIEHLLDLFPALALVGDACFRTI